MRRVRRDGMIILYFRLLSYYCRLDISRAMHTYSISAIFGAFAPIVYAILIITLSAARRRQKMLAHRLAEGLPPSMRRGPLDEIIRQPRFSRLVPALRRHTPAKRHIAAEAPLHFRYAEAAIQLSSAAMIAAAHATRFHAPAAFRRR